MSGKSQSDRRWPKTVEQAVGLLLHRLNPDAIAIVRSCPEGDLISLHHTLGREIRNNFGLWQGNAELLEAAGEEHPDGASQAIIRAAWRRLQDNPGIGQAPPPRPRKKRIA